MKTMDDISQMLDDCDSVLGIPRSRGGPGFSEWEVEFIESVRDQYESRGSLSPKQTEKLTELWNRI